MTQAVIAQRAGLHPVSVSRMVASGSARFESVELLAKAVGLKLALVEDNRVAEGLLLIDLDLKEINQRLGHDTGDKVLQTAIANVRQALGARDRIYRLVGAEFVICLPDKNASDAEPVKERLLAQIGIAVDATASKIDPTFKLNYGIVELVRTLTWNNCWIRRCARATPSICRRRARLGTARSCAGARAGRPRKRVPGKIAPRHIDPPSDAFQV